MFRLVGSFVFAVAATCAVMPWVDVVVDRLKPAYEAYADWVKR
jgi:hypothetical protein